MNTEDWIFDYTTQAIEWLNPVVFLAGLAIAVWAFRRCHKRGYLVIAIYFAVCVFTLLALPSLKRALSIHQAPHYSGQIRQKLDAAIQEATHKVLAEAGQPYGMPQTHKVHFPLAPMILVAGLWLLAKREPENQAGQATHTPTEAKPASSDVNSALTH
jgi:hypothetical protein